MGRRLSLHFCSFDLLPPSWSSTKQGQKQTSIKMADDEDTPVEIVLKTPTFDARFPNQNQTKNCWQNYLDYQKCIKAKGEEYEPCQYFFRTYRSLCPIAWVDKWNDQIEDGTFPERSET